MSLSVCLSVCLCLSLSVCLSVCLSMCCWLWCQWLRSSQRTLVSASSVTTCQRSSLPYSLCVCLSVCLSLSLSVCLSVNVMLVVVLVIEKFTENTRFCIVCNYLSKIIPALQSRCTRFRFGPLTNDQIVPRLDYVIDQERLVLRIHWNMPLTNANHARFLNRGATQGVNVNLELPLG